MKSLNLKLNLSQYLVLKNINQKDFLTGKSQTELENISRLLNVTLDLKPIEVKSDSIKPFKIDLPPTMEEVKSIVERVKKKEDLVADNSSENVTKNISKLLEFVKEVVDEENPSTESIKEYFESTSKKKKRDR